VIDLQRINHISVDASSGEAVIGTGSRLGDIALGLNNQGGRALPHGVCPYVGLGGHASFGGCVLFKNSRNKSNADIGNANYCLFIQLLPAMASPVDCGA
jgi:hypothetical protein